MPGNSVSSSTLYLYLNSVPSSSICCQRLWSFSSKPDRADADFQDVVKTKSQSRYRNISREQRISPDKLFGSRPTKDVRETNVEYTMSGGKTFGEASKSLRKHTLIRYRRDHAGLAFERRPPPTLGRCNRWRGRPDFQKFNFASSEYFGTFS